MAPCFVARRKRTS